MKRILTIIMFLIVMAPVVVGQERFTNVARDFWVLLLPSGITNQTKTLRLTAVGDTACTVSVVNPRTSWSDAVTMNASSSVNITLPATAVPSDLNATTNCAFHVTSTASVTLMASYIQESSCGVSLIMPTRVFGTHYVVLDYPCDPSRTHESGATVGFLAIDTTTLTMTLPCSIPGHATGSVLTLTLFPGQTHVLMCNDGNGSFSGMEVIGDHPFAMFQGNLVSGVPHNTPGGDYMYEQAVPVEQWGNDYAVVASKGRSVGDRVRCVNMVVNGTGDTTYSVNETDLPANSTSRIQAEHPFSVGFCTRGSNWNGEYGDPSLIMIPSLDNGVRHAGFVTFTTQRISIYHLNIVTRTEHVGSMTLDGNTIGSSQFSPLDAEYSYARLDLTTGTHFLDNSEGDFVAWVYGVGNVVCYAYAVGWTFTSNQVIIHDTVVYYDTVCVDQPYSGYGFDVESEATAQDGLVIRWRSEIDSLTVHHYCLRLTVVPEVSNDTTVYITMGDAFVFMGSTMTNPGDYVFHLTAANGCDSVLTIHLLYENPSATATATSICIGETVILTAVGLVSPYWTSSPIDASLETQQGQTTVVVSPRQTTTYTLYTSNGGDPVDTIVISVYTIPELCVELSPSVVDYDNPMISFSECTDDHAVSTWTFSDGTTDVGQSVRHQFDNLSSDRVGVTLQRCNGDYCCSDTTFFLSVVRHSLWFPNAFTPDEATNNLFGCKVSFEMVYFKLNIYTRQGLLIFSTDDPNATWDGTYQGNPMPQDSYVYYWYVYDGHDYRKDGIGTVTLLR